MFRAGMGPTGWMPEGGGFWPGGIGAHRREAVARLGSRSVKPVCCND